jgi:DNA uptake protein ComE-like DNA-binding protein
MTVLKPESDVLSDAFGLAIAFVLLASGSMAAIQGRPGTQTPMVLNEFVNPNTASVASLLRLPGIGPIRVQAIVAYRQACAVDHPGQKPFEAINDMMRIKGLGPRTVSALNPWLIF